MARDITNVDILREQDFTDIERRRGEVMALGIAMREAGDAMAKGLLAMNAEAAAYAAIRQRRVDALSDGEQSILDRLETLKAAFARNRKHQACAKMHSLGYNEAMEIAEWALREIIDSLLYGNADASEIARMKYDELGEVARAMEAVQRPKSQ